MGGPKIKNTFNSTKRLDIKNFSLFETIASVFGNLMGGSNLFENNV